jgi:hypothetical protein
MKNVLIVMRAFLSSDCVWWLTRLQPSARRFHSLTLFYTKLLYLHSSSRLRFEKCVPAIAAHWQRTRRYTHRKWNMIYNNAVDQYNKM